MIDFVAGFLSAWILQSLLDRRLRQLDRDIASARRKCGINPPPPDRKPAPPAGPPCSGGEITLAQWEDMRTHFVESQTQRGNGHGGPTTPKPPIKPQPTGGYLVREGQLWGGYQPRPQGGTPNPPPAEP